MDPGLLIFAFVGFGILILLFRLTAGSLDRDRIAEYIARRGGRILDVEWEPFGPGWFGSKNERIYRVRYHDGNGVIHNAVCKTGMLSGVYFTEDHPVAPGAQADLEKRRLREENRRLREELNRLKQNRPDA